MEIAIVLIAGYLLGSIPFGLVLTRIAGLGDIREIGSGNIGATNVLRTGRKDLALATLVLDAGKGAIAVLLCSMLFDPLVSPLAGSAAFLGHCFPIYLKFKGGKGVATFFGTLLVLNPTVGLLSIMAWLLTFLLFRYSSLGALVASLAAPLFGWLLEVHPVFIGSVGFMTLLIYIRHHENIRRLMKGEEPKVGKKSA